MVKILDTHYFFTMYKYYKYDMKSDYVRMWAISKEGSIVYPPIPIVMTLKINYVTIVYFLD